MEVTQDRVGTFAIEHDGSIYTAFKEEHFSFFLNIDVKSKFYEGKYPFFDDKNLLINEKEDKRDVFFNNKKISYFFQDYSALLYQAVLAKTCNTELSIIESETSKIILCKEDLLALIESLRQETLVAEEEKAWCAKHGEAWKSITLEAYDKLSIKYGVA